MWCGEATPRPATPGIRAGTISSVPTDVFIVLIIILIIVVIWRGPKTIPEIGRMFGRGVREARAEANKIRSSDEGPADNASRDGGTTG